MRRPGSPHDGVQRRQPSTRRVIPAELGQCWPRPRPEGRTTRESAAQALADRLNIAVSTRAGQRANVGDRPDSFPKRPLVPARRTACLSQSPPGGLAGSSQRKYRCGFRSSSGGSRDPLRSDRAPPEVPRRGGSAPSRRQPIGIRSRHPGACARHEEPRGDRSPRMQIHVDERSRCEVEVTWLQQQQV